MLLKNNNSIVEVDESKFRKQKFNRGYPVEGVWIVFAVSRADRRVVLQRVDKRDRETVTIFCTKYIVMLLQYILTDEKVILIFLNILFT